MVNDNAITAQGAQPPEPNYIGEVVIDLADGAIEVTTEEKEYDDE